MTKAIGIGGAGSKIAVKWDPSAMIVNVSQVELDKASTQGKALLATISNHDDLFQGSRMDPEIGIAAYKSVSRQISKQIKGALVFAATGGGTGNGITKGILQDLVVQDKIAIEDKTMFALILPYDRLEADEYVSNTSQFLSGPVDAAIDSGNTGNIFMFSNKVKFEQRIPEEHYNQMIVNALRELFAIPTQNTELKLLEGHIDQEDFSMFLAKPYFNHFTRFDYDSTADFGKQLESHQNTLLLPAEQPIEALFMLEVPANSDSTIFYSIVEYFNGQGVKPIYSVVENPEVHAPRVTVALLYSRKPAEQVKGYNKIAEEHAQTKVRKTLDQYVKVEPLHVDLDDEAKKANTEGKDDILAMLKRINKL